MREHGLICNGYHNPYNPGVVKYDRALRKNMTPAEKKLWYGLLRHFKYRVLRQRTIDNYIADFYCAKLRLVIEVDGSYHFTTQQQEYDKERTKILSKYKLQIIRFTNDQIFNDFITVCKSISNILPDL
jgi:very-short-patch-repair endonuclease